MDNNKDISKREVRGLRIGHLITILLFLIGIEASAILGYSKIMNTLEKGKETDNIQQTQLDIFRADLKALNQQVQLNSIQISALKANINDLLFKTK